MDYVDYAPRMLPEVVRTDVLADDPFVVVDVGCSLGIDRAWRLFEPHLRAEGFDPQTAEIRRLQESEVNAHVRYHAGLIGLPEDDPWMQARVDARDSDPSPRLSYVEALNIISTAGPSADFVETNNWDQRELELTKTRLDDAVTSAGLTSVDFIKTDTDGSDFEVLRSIEPALGQLSVLGFAVETFFFGSESPTAHTFHNVDRFMKGHRYALITLTVNRYSRAALPAPFTYTAVAQSEFGQPIWGDAVYLRDGVVGADSLSDTKLLKLACLFELFRVPDMAAELLLTHRDRLERYADVDHLLDLLTPPLNGRAVSYREYVAAFRADPRSFYPPAATANSTLTNAESGPRSGRLRRLLRR